MADPISCSEVSNIPISENFEPSFIQNLSKFDTLPKDGKLSFSELQNKTLPLPEGDSFSIYSCEDFETYSRLLSSENLFQSRLWRSNEPRDFSILNNATGWFVEDYKKNKTPLNIIQVSETASISIWDTKLNENGGDFLIEFHTTQEGSVFFVLHLAENMDHSYIEVGGKKAHLSNISTLAEKESEDEGKNKTQTLWASLLFVSSGAFQKPIPSLTFEKQEKYLNLLEKAIYNSDILPTFGEALSGIFKSFFVSSCLENVEARAETFTNGSLPKNGDVSFQGINECYSIPVHSESPLNKEELKVLESITNGLPAMGAIYEILSMHGALGEFSIVVVEDEVMECAYNNRGIHGKYNAQMKRIEIKRSDLKKGSNIEETYQHEMMHFLYDLIPYKEMSLSGFFARVYTSITDDYDPLAGLAQGKYFLRDYYLNLKERANKKNENSLLGVSLYSFKTFAEFLAEDTLAYVTGEEDKSIIVDPTHGPKSRSELRRKQPEMYLALRLFLEPESSYFGNFDVFLKDHLSQLENLAKNEDNLDPNLSPHKLSIMFSQA